MSQPVRRGPHGIHHRAAAHAVARGRTHLQLQLAGGTLALTLPPVERLAFYAGLAGFAALGVIEWPIALITGVGHLLADDHNNRTLEAFGDALEAV